MLMQEGLITGMDLANKLNITDRTVRNDIADINYELKKFNGSHIVSVRGKGYQIATNDKNEIFKLLQEDNVNETPQERLHYLGIRVLFSDNVLNLDDLEDEMFISKTRLEAVIKSINDRFKQNGDGCVVQHKKNAIFAKCSETTRRALLNDLILDKYESGHFQAEEYDTIFGQKVMENVGKCVHEVLEEHSIRLTDIDIIDIVIKLCIQKIRIDNGHTIKHMPSDYDKLKYKMVEIISNKIAENMEKKFKVCYCLEERAAIAVQLSNKRMAKAEELTKERLTATTERRYIVIVEELLNDIKTKFSLDLTHDEKLFIDLVMHIQFSIGIKGKIIHNRNPILKTIKNSYPFIFELSTYIWQRFYDIFGIQLSEDQLGYIAVHLGAAIERLESKKSSSNFTIAVSSNMSTGISQFLMAKLYSLYGNSMSILGPYPVYSAKEMFEANPSIVLTTTSTSLFKNAKVPVLNISPTLGASDISAINNLVSQLKRVSVLTKLPDGIAKYFEEDLFFPNMDFNNQYDVLKFLSEKMMAKGYVSDAFLEKTLEREQVAPTGFMNMIAMPHPIQICSYKTIIGVASLNKPILWGNQNAQLIFMLSMRGGDMKYLNDFFDMVVDLVQDKKKIQRLIDTKSFNAFLAELL